MSSEPNIIYGAGHPSLDRDHAVILSLLNELKNPALAARVRPEAILLEVRAYLDAHFENEEDLMEQFKYAGSSEHCLEHAALRAEAEMVLDRLTSGELLSVEEVAQSVEARLRAHMLGLDSQFAEFLARVDVEPGAERPSGIFSEGTM